MLPVLVQLTKEVGRICGLVQPPNAVNANLYRNGRDSVGWHADNEWIFGLVQQEATVVSLSLGQRRAFQIRLRNAKIGAVSVRLGQGGICVMEGMLQKYYVHRVPVERELTGMRINLTWRWIRRHQDTCPAGYQTSNQSIA